MFQFKSKNSFLTDLSRLINQPPEICAKLGGVAEWLRRSASNHARSTRVGSNPVVGTIYHKPTVNSAVHSSEVGK